MENREFSYESYRKRTIIKMLFMIAGFVLPIAVESILVPIYKNKLTNLGFLIAGLIVLILFEAWVVYKIIVYIRVLSSKEFAEKRYITLYDERNSFIRQKTNSFTLKCVLYGVSLGAVVFGTINQYVFITLLATAIVLLVVYSFTLIYYKNKY